MKSECASLFLIHIIILVSANLLHIQIIDENVSMKLLRKMEIKNISISFLNYVTRTDLLGCDRTIYRLENTKMPN